MDLSALVFISFISTFSPAGRWHSTVSALSSIFNAPGSLGSDPDDSSHLTYDVPATLSPLQTLHASLTHTHPFVCVSCLPWPPYAQPFPTEHRFQEAFPDSTGCQLLLSSALGLWRLIPITLSSQVTYLPPSEAVRALWTEILQSVQF